MRNSNQAEVATKNEDKIIQLLSQGPKTAMVLLNEINSQTKILSKMGLYDILSRLINDRRIKKEISNINVINGNSGTGRPIYRLTSKGIDYLESIWYLSSELLDLKARKASYMRKAASQMQGISSHIIFDENVDTSLMPHWESLEQLAIQEIINTISENKMILAKPRRFDGNNNDIKELENNIPSKAIISIEIDYPKLSSYLRPIQLFMKDIVEGRNILSNPELEFGKNKNKISLLERYFVDAWNIFNDPVFNKKSEKYLHELAKDRQKLLIIAPTLNLEALDRFVKVIEDDLNPLNDKKLLRMLNVNDTTIERNSLFALFDDYISASRLIKNNPEFANKLNDFIQEQDSIQAEKLSKSIENKEKNGGRRIN